MSGPDLKPTEIEYPWSDVEPIAESDVHRDLMGDLIASTRLEDWRRLCQR